MARHGITYSAVAAAASQLAASGSVPTIDNVRAALGHTGSKSTIGPLLRRWREAHDDHVVEANTGLPAELLHGVKAVYESLQQAARAELERTCQTHEAERQAFAEQRAIEQAKHQEAQSRCEVLAQELSQGAERIIGLEAEKQAQGQRISTLEQENRALQQRLSDRSAALEEMTRQLNAARAQFDHYQEVAAQQRAEERQVAEARIAGLERALHEVQQQSTVKEILLSGQQSEIRQMSVAQRELAAALSLSQADLAQLRQERVQLTETLAIRTKALAVATDSQAALQVRLQLVDVALAASKAEHAVSAARLLIAEAKIEQLVAEKLELALENARLDQQLQISKTR